MRELMKTSNPALRTKAFRNPAAAAGQQMTVNGTIGKSFVLLVLLLVTAGWCWSRFYTTGDAASVAPFIMGGVIGGLVLGFATAFKPTWAYITAPLYAMAEGFVVGGVSALFELRYPGIVVQAVALTLAVAFGMLILYRTGIIKVTDRLRRMIFAATLGIVIFYALTWLVSLFGVDTTMVYGHTPLSIGISLFIVAIAAFNLVLDFDMISQQAQFGAPRYMEWYGGFALMVTLIWLYLEILRLLANGRR
ncbi:MAG TPA: Bax inhibitor-1/YccA family protein [Gammaproteobacteria bacterium]|nr:Bax inhibitor-1/YccA family protein [Gammaproteobacteria bacterium]